MSFGKQKSSSSSTPLTPDQVAGFFNKIDNLTGGTTGVEAKAAVNGGPILDDQGETIGFRQSAPAVEATPGKPGQLSQFATRDFSPVEFTELTPNQLRSIGGAGATRQAGLQRSRSDEFARTLADPSLSTFQRSRSNQLSNDDFNTRSDAISKETEALIAQLASQQNGAKFQAGVTNKNLERDKLTAIANIFFGGKGNVSSGKSSGFNVAFKPPVPAGPG